MTGNNNLLYYGIIVAMLKRWVYFDTPTRAGRITRSCNLYPIFETTTTVPGSLPSTSCKENKFEKLMTWALNIILPVGTRLRVS